MVLVALGLLPLVLAFGLLILAPWLMKDPQLEDDDEADHGQDDGDDC